MPQPRFWASRVATFLPPHRPVSARSPLWRKRGTRKSRLETNIENEALSALLVPWCTTPIEADSSLGPDSHHPIISLSGIPSAVIVLRILHPILASTLCAANPLARIAEPTIAKRFFRKLLKGQGRLPWQLVTDKLRSYSAAHREVMPSVVHDTDQYRNNLAEVSHEPTRQRERQMRKFKAPGQRREREQTKKSCRHGAGRPETNQVRCARMNK